MLRYFIVLLSSLYLTPVIIAQNFSQFNCEVFSENISLDNPFVGGLNTMELSTTDLNFDGKLDVVIFDRVGSVVIPYLNISSSNDSKYTYAHDYVKYFPVVRGLLLLKDYNNDGIEDVFAFSNVGSTLDLYEGYRVGNHIEYKLFVFNIPRYQGLFYKTANDTLEIYVAPGDIPGIEDVDGDGDLDILSFLVGGEVVNLYQNLSVEKGYGLDTLIFELTDNCWGKFRRSKTYNSVILSENMGDCPSAFREEQIEVEYRHAGGATFCLYDDNGDGAMDLLLGDDQIGNLIQIQNGGTPTDAWMIAQDTTFPSYNIPFNMPLFASPFYADMDNDNKRDLIVSTNHTASAKNYDNIWFYKNIGTDSSPLFEYQNNSISIQQSLDFGGMSSPCFVDENADGLLDIVVGNYGYKDGINPLVTSMSLLRNIGTLNNPKFSLVDNNYLDFASFKADYSEHIAPSFGDLDNDGDLDLLIGDNKGKLYFLENNAGEGNPLGFEEAIYEYMSIDVSRNAKPAIIDINQDGLMDLVVGEKNNNTHSNGTIGSFNYFQNQGTTSEAYFDNDETAFPNYPVLGGIDVRDEFVYPSGSPCFVPVGEDYFLFTGCASGYVKLYSGILEDNFDFDTRSEKLGGIDVGQNSTIAVADIDNDGYFEMLIGNKRGGLNFMKTPIQTNGEISSVKIVNKPNQVFLYPNPVEDKLYIDGNIDKIGRVDIYSSTGVFLQSNAIINNGEPFNIDRLENGVLFVQVKWNDGSITTKKIIKVK